VLYPLKHNKNVNTVTGLGRMEGPQLCLHDSSSRGGYFGGSGVRGKENDPELPEKT